jgi:uncharacterized protein
MKRLMALCLLAILAAAAAPTAVLAQDEDSAFGFMLREQRKARAYPLQQTAPGLSRPKRAQPVGSGQRAPKRVVRTKAPAPRTIEDIIEQSEPGAPQTARTAQPGLPPLAGLFLQPPVRGPDAPSPTAPAATEQQVRTILVLGDSIGIQLGQGLREIFAERPDIRIDSRARADTGLVNAEARNWPVYAAEVAASGEVKPDLVLIMIGVNDNQRLRGPDGGALDILGDDWRTEYARRVDGLVQPFRDRNIPVIWVGLPVMKNARLSGALLAINGLFQERVERLDGSYFDLWEKFTDIAGGYTATGPDVDGETIRLRAGDGVHFTKGGARKLAFFVEQDVLRVLRTDPQNSAPDPAIALPGAAPQAPPAESGLGAVVATPDGDVPPAFPIKPAAGPVLTLTGQPVGNELAPAPAAGTAEPDPLYPKPGRGDDFSWSD